MLIEVFPICAVQLLSVKHLLKMIFTLPAFISADLPTHFVSTVTSIESRHTLEYTHIPWSQYNGTFSASTSKRKW